MNSSLFKNESTNNDTINSNEKSDLNDTFNHPIRLKWLFRVVRRKGQQGRCGFKMRRSSV